jgi:hypothetical protein
VLGNLCEPDLCCFDALPNAGNSVFHLFPFFNPTTQQIYSADTGNVFETRFTGYSTGGGPGVVVTDVYSLDSVLTKTTNAHGFTCSGTERKMTAITDYSYMPPHLDTIVSPVALFHITGNDTTYLLNPNAMPEEQGAGYLLHFFAQSPAPALCDSPGMYSLVQYDGCVYNGFGSEPIADSATYSVGYGLTGKSYYTIIGACQQQSYTYIYKNGTACGNFVPIASYSTAVPGVREPRITISPNPADHYLSFSLPGANTNAQVQIFDATGRNVEVRSWYSPAILVINTTVWRNGIYLAVISTGEATIRKTIVIQH